MVLLERIYYLYTPAHSLHAKSDQRTVTVHSICKEQRAHCLPANLDVASACDADGPAAASMIAITPQP